jgi:hypothetical protein
MIIFRGPHNTDIVSALNGGAVDTLHRTVNTIMC